MRAMEIYLKQVLAGVLIEETRNHYVFRYEDDYYKDPNKPAISLTMPKTQKEYSSPYLFPVFSNMLSEGANRKLQSRLLQIDENDDFGILMATGQYDTIGAITIKKIEHQ